MFDSHKKSVNGRTWAMRPIVHQDVEQCSQRFQIPVLSAHFLMARGVAMEEVPHFIDPKIKNLLPDPFLLRGMKEAVERTCVAIDERQKLIAYGDYDVDGATSSALLRRYFSDIGLEIDVHIPDRIEDGYGANASSLEKIKENGFQLVLMTDCGTTAFDALAHARHIGLDVIILDHHTVESRLPDCVALINPFRLDQDLEHAPDFKYLCAAGVSFLFCVGLNQTLRARGFFQHKKEPNLMHYLDLVALGTVCDVMALKGLNRALVKQGLAVLNQNPDNNIGLSQLAQVAGVSENIAPYHLGFVLGPRINAGGRVGKSFLGSNLLSTRNLQDAQEISQQLNQYNIQRQEIEQTVLAQAIQHVEKERLYERGLIMLGHEGWHPGVIGIVASRLKEKYMRPACVISYDDATMGKGSGRSVPGIELGKLMHQAVHQGLIEKGGGHSMAVGFSLRKNQFDAFYNFLESDVKPKMEHIDMVLHIDMALSTRSFQDDLQTSIQLLEPFGAGNAAPRFLFSHVRVIFCDIVGENHLRCQVADESGYRVKAMLFRGRHTPLHDLLMGSYKNKTSCHLVGTVKFDYWGGRLNTTLILEDGHGTANGQC